MFKRITLVAVMILVISVVTIGTATAQQDPNPNCTLKVPPNPLTSKGLMTPYQLSATDAGMGPCDEANPNQSAFVEAAIFDPGTRAISIYRPLVVNQGQQGAPRVPVTVPPGGVVGIWFGFQGTNLTLAGDNRGCVNGLGNSVFGQFAYCNAPFFFGAVQFSGVRPPPLGKGLDGLPCPTTRSFAVVDQDQSDNVDTQYKIVNGQFAQATAPGQADGTIKNASDNGLLNRNILPALGCKSSTAPDITTGRSPSPALALNELSAVQQGNPAALVPQNDPMVKVGDNLSPQKTGLYRIGVNQVPFGGQTPQQYCTLLQQIAPNRINVVDAKFFAAAASPDAAFPNLQAFLQDRFKTSLMNLNCQAAAGPGGNDHKDKKKHGDRYDR